MPPREVARREALEVGRREVLRAILAGRGMSEIEPVLAEAAAAELPLATVLAALEQSRNAADLRARLRAAAARARRARSRPSGPDVPFADVPRLQGSLPLPVRRSAPNAASTSATPTLGARIDQVRTDLGGRIDETNARVDRTDLGTRIDRLEMRVHGVDGRFRKMT